MKFGFQRILRAWPNLWSPLAKLSYGFRDCDLFLAAVLQLVSDGTDRKVKMDITAIAPAVFGSTSLRFLGVFKSDLD
jgi:hypothetical protein